MPGTWTPAHRAAYEARIAARHAAKERALQDAAAASAQPVVESAPEPPPATLGAKSCACGHRHWRGAGERPQDLGCMEHGCPCRSWHRNARMGTVPKSHHARPGRPQSDVPRAVVRMDDSPLLTALESLRGEVRALLARPVSDPILADRIERIRQMVLSIDGKVARPAAVKAVVNLEPIEGRLLNIERACVRLIKGQDMVIAELRRVASRPAVIREFRQDHRRIADGGQPASRQRRKAGAGRAPRPIEPTARAG